MKSLPRVTDHAVLRYLERAHGVPVEAVRHLLAIAAATGARDGEVVVGKRVKVVLENGIVVTALKRHWTRRETMLRQERRPAR